MLTNLANQNIDKYPFMAILGGNLIIEILQLAVFKAKLNNLQNEMANMSEIYTLNMYYFITLIRIFVLIEGITICRES